MRVIKKLTIFLLLFFTFSLKVNAETYYAKVASYEEALALGGDNLQSYKDGIAVFNRPIAGIQSYKNSFMYPTNLNPGYDFQEEYYKEIDFENVYRNNITGKGAVIAIIDTGCDLNHPDLRENIIGYYNSTDVSNEKDAMDKNGHGTFVAGVIAARDNNIGIVGVAPEAQLYIIKASYNNEGYFTYSDVIRAINKCVELGNINIINLSIGGDLDIPLLKEALEQARDNGILVICAAGNYGTDKALYPAAYQIGLSVASLNNVGTLADYSNYGINSNIAAPGLLYSTSLDNSYKYSVGTSFATPLVSGTAGLIYGQNQGMSKSASTANYVKNLILTNTDNKTYHSFSTGGTVKGKLNIQNIFKVPIIKIPNQPKLIITENKRTKQQIITVKSKKNIDIYYSINGAPIYNKMGKNIRLDKQGTYNIKFIAIKSGTKAASSALTEKIKVSKDVYSQDLLESMELKVKKKKMKSGTTQKITIETNGKKISKTRIKWKSSNPSIARIDNKGNITVASNAPKGKKVKFTAKIGNITRTITIKIK